MSKMVKYGLLVVCLGILCVFIGNKLVNNEALEVNANSQEGTVLKPKLIQQKELKADDKPLHSSKSKETKDEVPRLIKKAEIDSPGRGNKIIKSEKVLLSTNLTEDKKREVRKKIMASLKNVGTNIAIYFTRNSPEYPHEFEDFGIDENLLEDPISGYPFSLEKTVNGLGSFIFLRTPGELYKGATDVPLMMESPDLLNDEFVYVVYEDGHVGTMPVEKALRLK